MKINKGIIIGVGCLILFAIAAFIFYYWIFQGVYNKPALGIDGYYDENRDQIDIEQAVVGGIEGVQYITFRVTATNEDTVPLTFEIINATPYELQDVLPMFEQETVEVDETASWLSDLVDVEPFIGMNQEFTVTVLATSGARKDTERTFNIFVQVDEDPEAGFSIDITQGESNDPAFEPDEPSEDPEDPMEYPVKFRTTSLTYGTGAIAFTDDCGSELTAYGYEGSGGSSGKCERISKFIQPAIMNVPHSSQTAYLFQDATDPDQVYVCWNSGTGSNYKKYDIKDANAVKVDSGPESIEIIKEVLC